MIAREYNRRITVNEYTVTSDGFGGYTVSSSVYLEAWAKLVNPSSNRATELGLSDLYNSLVFRVRYNEELVNGRKFSLSYLDKEYNIVGITDVDQFHRELEIVCNTQLNSNPVG